MLHTNERIIKHKVGLSNLAEELYNVARACHLMGVFRDTIYRYKDAVDDGGVDALLDANRKKANLKNRVDPGIEAAAIKYAIDYPARGHVRVSNELRKLGTFVAPSGVPPAHFLCRGRFIRGSKFDANPGANGSVLVPFNIERPVLP